MKPPVALVAVLAACMLMTAVGAAFVSDSGNRNATASQHGGQPQERRVLPNHGSGVAPDAAPSIQGVRQGIPPGRGVVRHVSAQRDGGRLPFTGFLLIPLLLTGAGVLFVGVVFGSRLPAQSDADLIRRGSCP